jgi:hypothetical protein
MEGYPGLLASVASEGNGQDAHDRMRVPEGAARVPVVVLVVDPARARKLIVDPP